MPDDARTISEVDGAKMREIVGEPLPKIAVKEMSYLDKYARQFIEMSPFLVLGTSSAEGKQDVSPRGDPPGSVKIIDDATILMAERKGNRRADSMSNIAENPEVGMIFFLPGVSETLRINGQARLTDDPALLGDMAMKGSAPVIGVLVDIEHVYFHCAKAIIRSKLWDPETAIDRSEFPSYGQISRDQREPELTVEEAEAKMEENYRTELY